MLSTDNANAGLTPKECINLLAEHRHRWMIPTIVCAILATAYALVMTRYWEANQALVVRQEATTSESGRLGQFADLYQMRTFQETILELVKSRQVISETLKSVAQGKAANKPVTDEQIESLRKRLSMLPPGGAEFGKTEVFYLGVKDKNRERAVQLVGELSHQLDVRLRQLRNERAQSLITELQQQVDLAREAQSNDTARLAGLEAQVGADLAELRMLNSATSGQSDLRQQAVQLESESREIAAKVRDAEQLLVVLKSSQKDPQQLVAMPNSLLISQPTLRSMKDGLLDAQLRAARVGGTRTEQHPQVIAAGEAVEHIRKDLHKELAVAIQGVEVELGLGRQRFVDLKDKQRLLSKRLAKLAERRAEYSNHVAAVENSRKVLDQAREQLTEARAQQAAALSAKLVSTLDTPDAGTNPVGPRRVSVVFLGAVSGLILGLGWTFLTVTPIESSSPNGTEAAQVSESLQTAPVPTATNQTRSTAKSDSDQFDFPSGVTYTPYESIHSNGNGKSAT